MYTPVPGFAYIRVFSARDSIVYSRTPSESDLQVRVAVHHLLMPVLEVAAGLRPRTQLKEEFFSPSVRLHIRSWLNHSKPSKKFLLVHSLHAQTSGEFHGSATLGEHRHAFTGSYSDGLMLNFRLL